MSSAEDDWRHRAACTFDDVALFNLAGQTGPEAKRARSVAYAKCMWCPVLAECREDVMASEGNMDTRAREEFRAGLTPGERTALAKRPRSHRRPRQDPDNRPRVEL